jgi:type I restriction enzyme M protein
MAFVLTDDPYLQRALVDGHVQINGDPANPRIRYVAVNHTERLADPEEVVRARFWAELIYRYGYEPARIGLEVIVPDRTPRDVADIVVFRDDERTRPFAVVECKREGITDTEFEQAVEQAAGNGTWAKLRADYIGVVAGYTRRFLDFSSQYGVLERESNIIADLPSAYGRPQEYKYHKGTDLDISPVDKEQLISAINKSHQTLWGGGRLSPPTAFGELCKIIFIKIADENAPRRTGEPYQFQIKTHEPSHRLAARIRELYAKEQRKDPDVFSDTINVDDAALRAIVSHLEPISLSATDLDTKGVAFEQFMDGFFKGDFGQYFTPREIINFAVSMIELKASDRILDPACGSGGFLLHALDAIRAQAREYHPDDPVQQDRYWHDFVQHRLFGIEINVELSRVAKMNMILHDDGHSNIANADALERVEQLHDLNRGLRRSQFDIVLTNPPFGAQVVLAEHPYLADFALGVQPNRGAPRRTQKTEILFIERVWDFLRPGTGRCAIVLPDGILANASLQYVRDFMLDRFQIEAVVSLPPYAFFHFGAAVKSSLVFLRKRDSSEQSSDDELTFMAAPERIGYDASGRKTINDLPEVVNDYRRFKADPAGFLI